MLFVRTVRLSKPDDDLYSTTMNSFANNTPKPVDERESELLARVRKGDRYATNAMINRYDKWCTWYTNRIIRSNPSFAHCYDDVRQEVIVAMIEAMRTFDPERGNSLASYLTLIVGRCSFTFLYDHIGTTLAVGSWHMRSVVHNARSIAVGIDHAREIANYCNSPVDIDEVWDVVERKGGVDCSVEDDLEVKRARAAIERGLQEFKGGRQEALRAYCFGDEVESAVVVGKRFGFSGSRMTELFRALVAKVKCQEIAV